MNETADILILARQAHRAHDWASAAAHFDAVGTERLAAEDLAAYADATWWLGRVVDNLRLEAAAYDAFLADSQPVEAAWAAMLLGIFHLGRGDVPQGMGWIGRAGRLLEGTPECPAHGLLMQVTEVEPSLRAGQPTAAVDAAQRMRALGRRIDEPGLVLLGVNCEGRALIRAGQVADGLALLDEAMVAALDGRLGPFMSGSLYCHTIASCHEVADLRRMTRWTDLTEDWLSTLSAVGVFGGLCGVHRAQLHVLRGAWEEAERSALEVVPDLDAMRVDYAAEAWYVVGEARRLRGDPTAAQAYDEARARGRDPQPGRALLQLQGGDAAGAATSVRTAVTAVGDDPCGGRRYVRPRSRSPSLRDGLRTREPPRPNSRRRRRRMRPRGWRRWRPRHVERCCRPRAASRKHSRCSATPADAGTSWARRTRPPAPAPSSPRPTGRSATRSPRQPRQR